MEAPAAATKINNLLGHRKHRIADSRIFKASLNPSMGKEVDGAAYPPVRIALRADPIGLSLVDDSNGPFIDCNRKSCEPHHRRGYPHRSR